MTTLPDGTRIENWTQKPIRFLDVEAGHAVDIPPEDGAPIRIAMTHRDVKGSRYVTETIFGDTELPEPRDDGYCIVATVVKAHYPGRRDFVVPNKAIRRTRSDGELLVCQGFAI